MTAERTRSPWIKRAVIGTTAALMLGGGIGVAAHAGPDPVTVTGRGPTEQEAVANAFDICHSQGMGIERDESPRPVPNGVNEQGQLVVDFEVTARCFDPLAEDD